MQYESEPIMASKVKGIPVFLLIVVPEYYGRPYYCSTVVGYPFDLTI